MNGARRSAGAERNGTCIMDYRFVLNDAEDIRSDTGLFGL